MEQCHRNHSSTTRLGPGTTLLGSRNLSHPTKPHHSTLALLKYLFYLSKDTFDASKAPDLENTLYSLPKYGSFQDSITVDTVQTTMFVPVLKWFSFVGQTWMFGSNEANFIFALLSIFWRRAHSIYRQPCVTNTAPQFVAFCCAISIEWSNDGYDRTPSELWTVFHETLPKWPQYLHNLVFRYFKREVIRTSSFSERIPSNVKSRSFERAHHCSSKDISNAGMGWGLFNWWISSLSRFLSPKIQSCVGDFEREAIWITRKGWNRFYWISVVAYNLSLRSISYDRWRRWRNDDENIDLFQSESAILQKHF